MDSYRCPWCSHIELTLDAIQLHIEELHTEDSPFVVNDALLSSPTVIQESGKNIKKRPQNKSLAQSSSTTRTPIVDFLTATFTSHKQAKSKPYQQTSKGRLGVKELGGHAFEKSMPSSVRRALEGAARPVLENRLDTSGQIIRIAHFPNEQAGLIPVLANLCALDDTKTTYFCHSRTRHISRIRCDGNFCGYWNIQMLLTYVLAAVGQEERGLPTVLQIQDTIEKAWSNGICSFGREETGGILNTRKWIGTHDALAFFQQIGIPVSTHSFMSTSDHSASNALLQYVEEYFGAGHEEDHRGSIITQRPPIYLQRAGHSVTIVGLEIQSENRALLVFDPSHEPSDAIKRMARGRHANAIPDTLLRVYRRSSAELASRDEYEILVLADVSL